MLVSLHIQNIALIEECRLTLENGLNILSGETGAGKSIIIDALSFALGSRADKTLIRYGASSAVVEAEFSVSDALFPLLDELGLEPENTLIIRRVMTESKNEVRVNGQSFTLGMLKKLTSSLVDIHGQHEHQSLLSPAHHIELLDRYGAATIDPLRKQVSQAYHEYRRIAKELASYGDERERERRLDTLAFQIADIEKVNPRPDEEEELAQTREKMRNAEKIVGNIAEGYALLDGDEGAGVLPAMSMALSRLNAVSRYDDRIADWASRLESARIELDDIASSLRDYAEGFAYDSRAQEKIERRYDAIKALKRKYGATVEDVLSALDDFRTQYDRLSGAQEEIDKLTAQLDKATLSVYNACVRLSKARRSAAATFEKEISSTLEQLAMKGTRFSVSFEDMPEIEDFASSLTADGFDKVEFLISPNAGEPLRPLAKIASGGEMSRFMLALKSILARLDNIDTLVFDEIDTGISGVVAHTVAQKLYDISCDKQVIAITHLPQLASFAAHHYLISKSTTQGKTRTYLTLLEGEDRLAEVARLAGSTTAEGKAHAASLIAGADAYKTSK